MNRPVSRPARGFTLIEMVTVIVVLGVLAASAVPAFRTLTDVRRGAALNEIKRQLAVARSTAIMSGRPTGLTIQTDSSLQLVQVPTPGAGIQPLTGPLGETTPVTSLPGRFSGVSITSATSGRGETGAVTFWFAFDGSPQSRTPSGTLSGAWTADGAITLSGGRSITVRKITGVIE